MSTGANGTRGFGEGYTAGAQQRACIGLAEGAELLDLVDNLERERAQGGLGIDVQFGDTEFFSDFLFRDLAEGGAELVDSLIVDGEAGGRSMTSVSAEVLGALSEGRVEVESGHATAGARCRV